jgi:hypothetical protein
MVPNTSGELLARIGCLLAYKRISAKQRWRPSRALEARLTTVRL